MGGIVVRRFIVANQTKLLEANPIVGLFLVASPSLGARDANLLTTLSFALQHTQAAASALHSRTRGSMTYIETLRRSSQAVGFGSREENSWKIAQRVKRLFGLWRQVVEPFSAAAYFDSPGNEPLKVPGSDHKSIVKPLTPNAIQHRSLKRFISHVIDFNPQAPAGAPYLEPLREFETGRAYGAVRKLQEKAEE